MVRSALPILLLHPPYGDLTYPYHSLSYVAAPLRAAGYAVEILDVNALWFRAVFQSERVRQFERVLREAFEQLNVQASWTATQQQRVAGVLAGIAICQRLAPERAIEILQGPSFHDYAQYAWAQEQVQSFERVLSILYTPYPFATAFAIPPYYPCAAALLAEVEESRQLKRDLVAVLRSKLRSDKYAFCGVSIPFNTQLQPSLVLLDAVGELLADTPRVAGGTAVADMVKAAIETPQTLISFRRLAEALYVGEAETGVVDLVHWITGEDRPAPSQVVDLRSPVVRIGCASAARYVSLSGGQTRHVDYDWTSAPPVYDWIDWSLYLAPNRHVNYSPTRGCFWNKCTFCDYGLNTDGPTAPSRAMNVLTVVQHLESMVEQGVSDVYFAVDAIDPKFLIAMGEALVARGLPLRWSTELFLTSNMTVEVWNLLHRSGMSTASFGLESGSSRVLEKMGKGKERVERVLRPVFQSVRESAIGLQPKYFYGFPGETDEDRQATVDLLLEFGDVFSVLTKGNLFDLTAGAYAAKHPEEFGICNIRRKVDDDIGGGTDYDLMSGDALPTPASLRPFNDQINYPHYFERPWAGGIDTLHSKLYIQRYGRRIFGDLLASINMDDVHQPPWTALRVHSRFDLDEALTNALFQKLVSNDCMVNAVVAAMGNSAETLRQPAMSTEVIHATNLEAYELLLK